MGKRGKLRAIEEEWYRAHQRPDACYLPPMAARRRPALSRARKSSDRASALVWIIVWTFTALAIMLVAVLATIVR
jgi:hypothetical protein